MVNQTLPLNVSDEMKSDDERQNCVGMESDEGMALEAENAVQKLQLIEMQPKASYYDFDDQKRDGLNFLGKYDVINNGFWYQHAICVEIQCIFRKKRGERNGKNKQKDDTIHNWYRCFACNRILFPCVPYPSR